MTTQRMAETIKLNNARMAAETSAKMRKAEAAADAEMEVRV